MTAGAAPGWENLPVPRREDLDARCPGLLDAILSGARADEAIQQGDRADGAIEQGDRAAVPA